MLIILGGLPGVGKTTIARQLAQALSAIHLRIDTIETALTHSHPNITDVKDTGYVIAYHLAKDNLLLGHTVIADSVNPIELTRAAWRNVAIATEKDFVEIEFICSDETEHQKRVTTRIADIKDHKLPNWKQVQEREYEAWNPQGITINTANSSPEESVQKIMSCLSKRKSDD